MGLLIDPQSGVDIELSTGTKLRAKYLTVREFAALNDTLAKDGSYLVLADALTPYVGLDVADKLTVGELDEAYERFMAAQRLTPALAKKSSSPPASTSG